MFSQFINSVINFTEISSHFPSFINQFVSIEIVLLSHYFKPVLLIIFTPPVSATGLGSALILTYKEDRTEN